MNFFDFLSERSSIFLFQESNQHLTVFSSLDLEKNEICLPKSSGVAGWVFENRKGAIVNRPQEDVRFYNAVDNLTGFHTRNIVCAPLMDQGDRCLGTLQSLNKKDGDFTIDDLQLLDSTGRLLVAAVQRGMR